MRPRGQWYEASAEKRRFRKNSIDLSRSLSYAFRAGVKSDRERGWVKRSLRMAYPWNSQIDLLDHLIINNKY